MLKMSSLYAHQHSKGINWINALKAVCIIFVFLRHSETYYGKDLGWFDGLFLTFYVNAFFFVSGYLLFWKQLSEPKILEDTEHYLTGGGKVLFLNVLYRIVIPSIIFSIIEFLPSCLIQGREIDVGYALYKTIGGGTYWFTSALAVAELILLALLFTRKRNVWFYAAWCFAFSVAGLIIVHLGILKNGIWAWRQGLISLSFIAMGGLYWKYEKKIDKLMKWWFVLPLSLVYVAMSVLMKGYNDPLISTLKIQPLGVVTSAVACLLLVWLCKILPEIKPLTFIGQNSIGFYFLSGALPLTFSIIAHKAVSGNYACLMLTIWAACLVVAYIAVAVINRWFPWLWDLRKVKGTGKPVKESI